MLIRVNNWTYVHALAGAKGNCNSKCTYHDTAHGNSHEGDSKEKLHVGCAALFTADEEHNITGALLPNLYQSMKSYNFLFNKYIRQQALQVTSLINQQIDPPVHYVHALVVLYRRTAMSTSSFLTRTYVKVS
jgi:hypothetical protein